MAELIRTNQAVLLEALRTQDTGGIRARPLGALVPLFVKAARAGNAARTEAVLIEIAVLALLELTRLRTP